MSGIESEQEYDDTAKLHADGDSKLAGNLNNILETNKEPEEEDSDSGLKSLFQKLDKDEEIEEKINKDPADVASKVWQNLHAFEKFKTKMKTFKKPRKLFWLIREKVQ